MNVKRTLTIEKANICKPLLINVGLISMQLNAIKFREEVIKA